MPTRNLRHLFLCAALPLIATVPAAAETVHKVVSGVYRLAPGGTLDLSNVNGSITIEAWDRSEIEVRADKIAKSPNEDEANKALQRLKVFVDSKPSRLRVEAKFPHQHNGVLGWLSGRNVETKVEFKVHIPREVNLEIENVNGAISLTGGKGEISLVTVNGGVTASDAQGNVKLESTNGGIEAVRTRGVLSAATINGRVEAQLIELGAGKISLESTNGGISLELPASARANLSASTTNGHVSCDFEVDGTKKRSRIEGTLNGGGPEIELDTVNGSISISELSAGS